MDLGKFQKNWDPLCPDLTISSFKMDCSGIKFIQSAETIYIQKEGIEMIRINLLPERPDQEILRKL
jgi:hypothetical protein